ncbi:hypothetical protein OF829_02180 [Sphingomonas sp. LB-2]|nr:hypothetical protein [Sphingomonas caeni]MCW3846029.1 hypothetical protein [Sphingomonas caeni]
MDWVIRQNIEKFERLIAAAPDAKERARLQSLLDAERAKGGIIYKQPAD